MTSLVEMSGAAGARAKMNTPVNINNMSNYAVGVMALKMLSMKYPGMTAGDLIKLATNPTMAGSVPQTMGKFTLNPVSWVSTTVDGIGDTLNDIGHGAGQVWRSVWDSPIGELAEDGSRKLLKLAPKDRGMDQMIELLGQKMKMKAGGLPMWAWGVIGTGVVVTMLFAFKKKKKK